MVTSSISFRFRAVAELAAAVAVLASAAGFQPAAAQLTLREAIQQADRSAYSNRIATAETAVQSAQSIAPLKGILPSVHFEAGYIRTTDPIGVFGSTLRQRSITQANFDPQRLNYPDALGNHQGAVVVEQPLLNADAWIGRRSAAYAADATRASEEWTKLSTRVDVVRAYYGVVLASERASTLRSAARAAHAHVSQAEALVRQGLATRSDALLASVRAGEIDAQLAEADGAATTARQSLAVLLGQKAADGSSLVSPAALPSGDRIRAVVSMDTAEITPAERADVKAALKGFDAANANAKRAKSLFMPRVNSFARYDWNSADRPFAGDRNWTVGIMATWTPFTNPADIADLRAAGARGDAARAQAEAAQANARLELEQTRTSLQVALARLSIAERAVAQSAEAHRIVGRKYEGGLAQVVELLDAQAVETQSALSFSQARWSAIVAAAERLRALGKDPGALEELDAPDSRSTSLRN
ncbi:MAG: TolC family protein [Gemmatimonas sp.]